MRRTVTVIAATQFAPQDIPPLRQIVHGPITFVSHCARHGMPYFGRAYVGYLPTSGRLGPAMLRRMVLQAARHGEDRLERELAAMLQVCVRPAGVALVLRSAHDCAGPRLLGDGSGELSTSWRGRYKTDRQLRAEFLARCAA